MTTYEEKMQLEKRLRVTERALLNVSDFLDSIGMNKCKKCPYVNIRDVRAPQECSCHVMFLEQARQEIEDEIMRRRAKEIII